VRDRGSTENERIKSAGGNRNSTQEGEESIGEKTLGYAEKGGGALYLD